MQVDSLLKISSQEYRKSWAETENYREAYFRQEHKVTDKTFCVELTEDMLYGYSCTWHLHYVRAGCTQICILWGWLVTLWLVILVVHVWCYNKIWHKSFEKFGHKFRFRPTFIKQWVVIFWHFLQLFHSKSLQLHLLHFCVTNYESVSTTTTTATTRQSPLSAHQTELWSDHTICTDLSNMDKEYLTQAWDWLLCTVPWKDWCNHIVDKPWIMRL